MVQYPRGRRTIGGLKGKVVLVDFWAYSCINCQRATPHLLAWDKAYKSLGLQIVGIHSPEFAFEKSAGNVQSAISKEDITYPVGPGQQPRHLDGVPQPVLAREVSGRCRRHRSVDQVRRGRLRPDREPDPRCSSRQPRGEAAATGRRDCEGRHHRRRGHHPGDLPRLFPLDQPQGPGKLTPSKTVAFGLNTEQPNDTFSLGGNWAVGTQSVTSTTGSQARLNFQAAKVFHVLSGEGTVTVSVPGEPDKTFKVTGTPNAYQLVDKATQERKTMTLTYSPGVSAFTFSFG